MYVIGQIYDTRRFWGVCGARLFWTSKFPVLWGS